MRGQDHDHQGLQPAGIPPKPPKRKGTCNREHTEQDKDKDRDRAYLQLHNSPEPKSTGACKEAPWQTTEQAD